MRTGNNFGNIDQLYIPSEIVDKHCVVQLTLRSCDSVIQFSEKVGWLE